MHFKIAMLSIKTTKLFSSSLELLVSKSECQTEKKTRHWYGHRGTIVDDRGMESGMQNLESRNGTISMSFFV